MGIVDVANLKKSYGEIVAVDDISFSIEKGEIFGFLGPNGAGKTSTINMMIGLSRPTVSAELKYPKTDGIACPSVAGI